jgi:hypothetical protein
MNTQSYIDYFKVLCGKHATLRHDDTNGARVFAVVGQDEAVGDLRTGGDTEGWLFRLVVPQWSLVDTDDGRTQKDWLGGFIIAKFHSQREAESSEKFAILDQCDAIGEDFANRMLRDCENGHPLFHHSIRTARELKFKALPKMNLPQGYIGRLFTFSFQNAAKKACITTNWLDGI